LKQNSPVSRTFLSACFSVPSGLRTIVSETIGGMTQTTVKKENGARLVKPLLFTVDAQPMGRGTTAPLRSRDYLQFDPAIIEKRPVCRGNHGHEPSDAIQDAICQLLRLCCRSRLNAKGVVI
jgi:hypothetical protein